MQSNPDLVVVGAGFAGLACARAAAARGLDTVVLERRPQVGARPHTTGLLVREAADLLDLPRELTRRIRGIRLYAPSLRSLDLRAPGYSFLATDTGAVLRHLADGLDVRTGVSFPAPLRPRYLVGADGARSRVARVHGLGRNDSFLVGVEAHYVNVRGVDPSFLHCFLDSRLAPGYLAWVVPGLDATQVGLAARPPHRPDLDALIRHCGRLFDFSRARLVERRAGLIPVGGPVRPHAGEGVLLIGDAAGTVSPLTAGGIRPALEVGRKAGLAIAAHLLDGGRDPGRAVALPRYRFKRLLRFLADRRPSNAVYELLFDSALFVAAARAVFFR